MLLRCHLDLPANFLNKAKYTLETLLFPLGLEPIWVEDAASAMIRYQSVEENLSKQHEQIVFHYAAQTEAFLSGKLPLAVYHELDPIAQAFFWLSDSQTYLIQARDVYGRLCFADAAQNQLQLPDVPMVDVLREEIAKALSESGVLFQRRTYQQRHWAFCPTHDIDHLHKYDIKRYLYEWKNSFQNKSARLTWKRARPSAFLTQDIYQSGLRFFRDFHQQQRTKATYFLKAGAQAPQDHFYRLDNTLLAETIEGHEVGLHPNFHAHHHEAHFKRDLSRFEQHLGKSPRAVRQHYLRYHPQETPRYWEENGFLIDSTLAFPDKTTFRNQTCFPFRLYDLVNDMPRKVWEMPLILHDTVLFQYEGYDVEAALQRSREILAQVQKFGGVCVALWHPVIYDQTEYPHALAHFTTLLPQVKQEGAFVGGLEAVLDHFLTPK